MNARKKAAEDGEVDEDLLRDWLRQAAAQPGWDGF